MLLNKKSFSYTKEDPDVDAFHIIIVCEGEKREYQYFKFFSGIDSRLKVKVVPPVDGNTHPEQIYELAGESAENLRETEYDQLWIVIDTEHDPESVKSLIPRVKDKEWNLGLSNPCFEVWLYNHQDESTEVIDNGKCAGWKQAVADVFLGGFNSYRHPTLIKTAITNSKEGYSESDGLPNVSCTNLFNLGNVIYPLVKDRLEDSLKKD